MLVHFILLLNTRVFLETKENNKEKGCYFLESQLQQNVVKLPKTYNFI